MKIDPETARTRFNTGQGIARPSVQTGGEQGRPQVTDSVTLSEAAMRASAAQEVQTGVADFNSARVAELRHIIAAGNYTIDPDRVARKLRMFGI